MTFFFFFFFCFSISRGGGPRPLGPPTGHAPGMCARQLCEHMDGLAGCAKIHIHVDMHSTSLSSHHRVKIDPIKPKQKVTICDFSI